jgi:ribosomal protein S18 acetylase RimI-like enzyme
MNAIDILTKAFDKNKSVNYVIKQDYRRENRIRSLIEYSYNKTFRLGKIFSIDNKAYAFVSFPHRDKTDILANLKLIFSSLGIRNIKRVLRFKSQLKKHYPKEFVYLDFIGVDPLFQGQGIGSALVQEIKAFAKQQKLPLYLETSTIENVAFYKKNGFEQYGELQLEYPLFLFRLNVEKNINEK